MSFLRAVFLDRDGVINRKAPDSPNPSYIRSLSEFQFLPDALNGIAELRRLGYAVFVITNQRGIARGILKPEDLYEIHTAMLASVRRAGGDIEQIYVCPHDHADRCACRKPQPGMLLQAQAEHAVDMAASWMIGDSAADVAAGRCAGCRTVFIGPEKPDVGADLYAASLLAAADQIRRAGVNDRVLNLNHWSRRRKRPAQLLCPPVLYPQR